MLMILRCIKSRLSSFANFLWQFVSDISYWVNVQLIQEAARCRFIFDWHINL